jgi:release factor glutamine methyltransferase
MTDQRTPHTTTSHSTERRVARLRAAGCVYAEREAALIEAAFSDPRRRRSAVARRCAGEPLEYVVGAAEFAGVSVEIGAPAFIPRARAVDLVVALERLHHPQQVDGSPADPVVALDLGCGCGAIAAALRHRYPAWEIHASDIDRGALTFARRNASTFGFLVHEGDWFDALPDDLRGRLGVVVAHLPYVPTAEIAHLPRDFRDAEPLTTVDGGPDGLDPWREVAALSRAWIAPDGIVLTQVSPDQVAVATEIAHDHGLAAETIAFDESAVLVVRPRRAG